MTAINFCGSCGARREAGAPFCATCGASFTDLRAPPASLAPAFAAKAGFWVRTWSFVIDLVLISTVLGLAFSLLGTTALAELSEVVALVSGLVQVGYFVIMWSDRGGGQTIGMRAVGTRVVRTDGAALSIPTALLRYLGLSLGLAVFFLGVIAIVLDPRRQGWHDRMVGTYVLRT